MTIHCIVGQWTAKQGCDFFAQAGRQASANYVVGCDGSIGICVEECNRAWTSGGGLVAGGMKGSENDHRAITIEVASDTEHPYAVTDKAMEALISLLVDICQRNPLIGRLRWKGNKNLVGHVAVQNMTVHRWLPTRLALGIISMLATVRSLRRSTLAWMLWRWRRNLLWTAPRLTGRRMAWTGPLPTASCSVTGPAI